MRQAYQRHIKRLAESIGCRIYMASDRHGMMYVEFGYVVGPLIAEGGRSNMYPNMQSKYAANLHELGHFVLGHTQGRPPFETKRRYFDIGVLKSEAQAWNFVLENMIDTPEPATLNFMLRCFQTYLFCAFEAAGHPTRFEGDGDRSHVEFTYDNIDRYIFDTFESLGGDRQWLIDINVREPGCGHVHTDVISFGNPTQRSTLTMKTRGELIKIDMLKGWEKENVHFSTEAELRQKRAVQMLKYIPMIQRERKGRKLLRRFLSTAQWTDYKTSGRFNVFVRQKMFRVGGYAGVKELDGDGQPLWSYCIHAKSADLSQSDVLVAQRFMLELDYDKFMATANKRMDEANPQMLAMYATMQINQLQQVNAWNTNFALYSTTGTTIIGTNAIQYPAMVTSTTTLGNGMYVSYNVNCVDYTANPA